MIQKKSNFKCRRCGYCCQFLVRLTKKEIEDIKKSGYKEEDFVETDSRGRKRIKFANYYCYFLKIENCIATCKIYPKRPKACRLYPFFGKKTEPCVPSRRFDVE